MKAFYCVLVFSAACGFERFPRVGTVTRIEVRSYDNRQLHVLRDSVEIARVVAFVNARTRGWGGPRDWLGVPAGQLRAEFYDSTVASNRGYGGSFGAGNGFFETQRDGRFATRGASKRELGQFAALIHVPVEWFVEGIPRELLRSMPRE